MGKEIGTLNVDKNLRQNGLSLPSPRSEAYCPHTTWLVRTWHHTNFWSVCNPVSDDDIYVIIMCRYCRTAAGRKSIRVDMANVVGTEMMVAILKEMEIFSCDSDAFKLSAVISDSWLVHVYSPCLVSSSFTLTYSLDFFHIHCTCWHYCYVEKMKVSIEFRSRHI